MSRKLLWLDDLRNPYLNIEKRLDKKWYDYDIIWVRNYEEFKYFIEGYDLPDVISFDHDLGDSHYTPEKYWGDYDLSKTYQMLQNHTEKTGLDCAKFLINYILDNEIEIIPEYLIHSANPVGADNIRYLLDNFVKYRSQLKISKL